MGTFTFLGDQHSTMHFSNAKKKNIVQLSLNTKTLNILELFRPSSLDFQNFFQMLITGPQDNFLE